MPSATPAHKYTPTDAKRAVANAFAAGEANNILAALHAFELTFAESSEWPWMRWRHLSEDDPAYLDALPDTIPGNLENNLATTVLHVALAVRRANTENNGAGQLFKAPAELIEASKELGPSLQLELMMLGVHERRWKVVEALASRLLAVDGVTGNAKLDLIADDLLLDTLFFSIYRPYMPHYVDNPKPLVDRLAALAEGTSVARVLARGSIAALTYRANMLALTGAFDDALELYQQAVTADGFRSPVFQQVQTLLPVNSLRNEDQTTDIEWYHARSTTHFHYTHAPAGEHGILVSAEPSYFERYAALYASIVGTCSPGALIHFHLINFPADQADTLAKLREIEKTCGVRINHSFEVNQLLVDRPQLKGGVCVNTRYIYLPDYLEAYASVTITDIDGWLTKPVAGLTDFGDRDTLVSSWIWKKNTGYWRLPWGNVSGGYVSIRSTEASLRFARLIAQYLSKLFARNAYSQKPMFYADQAAHFLCLKHAEKHWGMNIGFIGGGFAQSAELPFHDRFAGKQQAMRDKLAELQEGTEPNAGD